VWRDRCAYCHFRLGGKSRPRINFVRCLEVHRRAEHVDAMPAVDASSLASGHGCIPTAMLNEVRHDGCP
jgi:hypothetical protein